MAKIPRDAYFEEGRFYSLPRQEKPLLLMWALHAGKRIFCRSRKRYRAIVYLESEARVVDTCFTIGDACRVRANYYESHGSQTPLLVLPIEKAAVLRRKKKTKPAQQLDLLQAVS